MILLGNLLEIILTFGFTLLFKLVDNTIQSPDISHFITNDSMLMVNFSILTSVMLAITIKWNFNKYNILSVIFAVNIGLRTKGISITFGLIPFVLSTILLFFALKDQRKLNWKYNWLKKSNNKTYRYDIFLSFAIAGNKNATNRNEVETMVEKIDYELKELGYKDIFNASLYFDKKHQKQEPAQAATEDFEAVENSRNFILFYPESAPTSALMELGYA